MWWWPLAVLVCLGLVLPVVLLFTTRARTPSRVPARRAWPGVVTGIGLGVLCAALATLVYHLFIPFGPIFFLLLLLPMVTAIGLVFVLILFVAPAGHEGPVRPLPAAWGLSLCVLVVVGPLWVAPRLEAHRQERLRQDCRPFIRALEAFHRSKGYDPVDWPEADRLPDDVFYDPWVEDPDSAGATSYQLSIPTRVGCAITWTYDSRTGTWREPGGGR